MIEYHNNIAIIKDSTHWTEWVKEQNKLDVDSLASRMSQQYINEGDTVLDIGANIGSHSIVYANKITSKGKLFAIDADEEHCMCLKHNLPDWVNIMNFAVSNRVGVVGFKKYKNTACNRCVENSGALVVNTYPLDYYFANTKIDFIKIDIEGYEIKAIEGMQMVISNNRPILCLESNKSALKEAGYSQEQLYDTMSDLKYSFTTIESSLTLFDAQPNIICLPK
jgi:FkbM family methyltransferase